jgi:transcriptional antiterminator RfaH
VVSSLNSSSASNPPGEAWYVVHSRTRAEHVAAGLLHGNLGIPTYCPRIKFQRSTARGKVWFIEALFPSYFFARFDPGQSLRAVRHSQGVLSVVEFGDTLVPVPESALEQIRREMDHEEIREIRQELEPGDVVEVAEGPMRGFSGIVHSLRKGEDRVRVLLEFLGTQHPVELPRHTLLQPGSPRLALSEGSGGLA